MDASTVTPIAVFFAGMISVLSPCVLPLLPAILAYSTGRGRLKPLAIVLGLSISFTLMGIVTSAFGSAVGPYLQYLNILAEIVIIVLGLVMLFELDLFSHLGRLSNIQVQEKGLTGGLILGISLGIVWIPCVGPILGAVLTMVAMERSITNGALMLLVYSMGFAIPMLTIAYSANISTKRLGKLAKYDVMIKKIAGLVLIVVGLWMAYNNHIV
jgi:cytochrome c-type biogenesis protein